MKIPRSEINSSFLGVSIAKFEALLFNTDKFRHVAKIDAIKGTLTPKKEQ